MGGNDKWCLLDPSGECLILTALLLGILVFSVLQVTADQESQDNENNNKQRPEKTDGGKEYAQDAGDYREDNGFRQLIHSPIVLNYRDKSTPIRRRCGFPSAP